MDFYDGLILGVLSGVAVTAFIAALAARSYLRLLTLKSVRKWRTPEVISGHAFYIVPEAEYRELDNLRLKALAGLKGVGRIEKKPWWNDRPDFDFGPGGGTLRPGG